MLEILVGTSSSGGHNLPPIPGQLKKRLKNLVGTGNQFPLYYMYVPMACFEVVAKRALYLFESYPFEVRFFESLQKDQLQLHLGM